MNHFKLTVRTPLKDYFVGNAKVVTLNTTSGQTQIFSDHASMTSSISFSPLEVEEDNGNIQNFLIRNGIIFFNNDDNSAIILALYCEEKTEVSYKSAEEYADFIEQQLRSGQDLSQFEIDYLEGEKVAITEQLDAKNDLENEE